MRLSVLFALIAGIVLAGITGTSILTLRAIALDRPALGGWDDLIVLPLLAGFAWLTAHAMYGAEMNARVNDDNRRTRAFRAAIKANLKAPLISPDAARNVEDRRFDPSSIVDLAKARADARADAELGGLKPPSDKDA